MKNGTALSCLLIATSGLSLLVAGCASNNTQAAQQAGYPKDKVDAPGLFAEKCATCHSRDALWAVEDDPFGIGAVTHPEQIFNPMPFDLEPVRSFEIAIYCLAVGACDACQVERTFHSSLDLEGVNPREASLPISSIRQRSFELKI